LVLRDEEALPDLIRQKTAAAERRLMAAKNENQAVIARQTEVSGAD
jgi:hypothetical protein